MKRGVLNGSSGNAPYNRTFDCRANDRGYDRGRPTYVNQHGCLLIQSRAKHRLKGDRSADGAGEVFCGRVRVRVRCVHGNQIRTSAAVCVSRSPSTTTIFNPSSSKYCTSNGRDARLPECAPSALRGNLRPIGQDLRLTIVSTDENDSASKPGVDTDKDGSDADKAGREKPVNSIGEMYAALRTCWMPPPKDSARHGMEYTVRFALKRDGEIMAPPRVTYSSHDAPAGVRDVYRDAVNAALGRCTPLHFSDRMGRAVAGRPIAIRFVDNRTIDDGKSLQSPQQ